MKYVYLSHALTPTIPVYGGQQQLDIKLVKDQACGDSCFVSQITFENHWGSHIDGVGHFFKDGRPIGDYPAEFWIFKSPAIVPLVLTNGQIVTEADVCVHINSTTDIILLSSGWSQWRHEKKYAYEGPGLSASLGLTLRKKFPQVRVIAMDWVSTSSFMHRDIGREAHRAFLNPQGQGNPILLAEDMNFSSLHCAKLNQVILFPLRVDGLDSAPCTAVGVIDD